MAGTGPDEIGARRTDAAVAARAASASAATLGGARRRPRSRRRALDLLVVVGFGLLFAYDVWEAIGNLLGLRAVADQLGTALNATGWTVLVAGLLLPVVCFVAALLVSRRRSPLGRAGILLVALCASAVLALDVQLVFGFESLVDLV